VLWFPTSKVSLIAIYGLLLLEVTGCIDREEVGSNQLHGSIPT
jgi:hypothetical protein